MKRTRTDPADVFLLMNEIGALDILDDLHDFLSLKHTSRLMTSLTRWDGVPIGHSSVREWKKFCGEFKTTKSMITHIVPEAMGIQKICADFSDLFPKWNIRRSCLRGSLKCDFCDDDDDENLPNEDFVFCMTCESKQNKFSGPKCDFCGEKCSRFFITPVLEKIKFDRIKAATIAKHVCVLMCKKIIFNNCYATRTTPSIHLGGVLEFLDIRVQKNTFPNMSVQLLHPLKVLRMVLLRVDSLEEDITNPLIVFLSNIVCDKFVLEWEDSNSVLDWLTIGCFEVTEKLRTKSFLFGYESLSRFEFPSILENLALFVNRLEGLEKFSFNFCSTTVSAREVQDAFESLRADLPFELEHVECSNWCGCREPSVVPE